MAEGSKANQADEPKLSSEERERQAWKKLLVRLGALRGHPRATALLTEKHAELLDITADGPSVLTEEYDEKVKKWFHRKLKTKDGGKVRSKLCDKLANSLHAMSEELIGSDRAAAIERALAALTQGTVAEGPLVCSLLAKELEGTRFEGTWISQDGKGMYRLGADGRKVAVQVLDGKVLIHGYFEGSILHPLRVPVTSFLAEFGEAAKDACDDCDLFGGSEASKGQSSQAKSPSKSNGDATRSRSPRKEQKSQHDSNNQLPPGWVKRESRSKPGVYYYANEEKGLTQFDRPTA